MFGIKTRFKNCIRRIVTECLEEKGNALKGEVIESIRCEREKAQEALEEKRQFNASDAAWWTARIADRWQRAARIHPETFSEFKNAFKDKDVVLIGAGPSVNSFVPIKDCIYVGLNRACLLKSVKFDFLFSIDKIGIDKIYQEFGQYDCVKFIGDQCLGANWQIPEHVVSRMTRVRRYVTDSTIAWDRFALHPDYEPLGNFSTVSLQAMQFILFGHPRRIYLVGIDCSSAGHFCNQQGDKQSVENLIRERGENGLQDLADSAIKGWRLLKEFKNAYYPDIEIISINPVGLKGLFRDSFTAKD